MPPEPRVLLAFAVVLGVAIVLAGLLVLARIWRRPRWKTIAETGTTEAIEQIGYSSEWLDRVARAARALVPLAGGAERARQLHSKAIELRARAADRREAEHAALMGRELAAGPMRRPYDGEHRRGVPIHRAP